MNLLLHFDCFVAFLLACVASKYIRKTRKKRRERKKKKKKKKEEKRKKKE